MADQKITDLTSYTPPIDADVLPIVDTATSTTKKITWANLKAAIKTYYDSVSATLTGKTIDGDDNTVQDLAVTVLKTVSAQANKFLTFGTPTATPIATKEVPTGTVVGTTDTQTLTNKTLTSPVTNNGTSTGETLITPVLSAPTFNGTAIGGQFAEKVIALSAGTPIAINASLGNLFSYSMASNVSIGTPTGTLHGQKIIIMLKATATATATVTSGVAGGWAFGTDVTGLTQTTSGKTDVIGAIYSNILDRWIVVAYAKGYS